MQAFRSISKYFSFNLTLTPSCLLFRSRRKKQVQDTRGQLFNASISIPSTEQSPNLKYRRENDEPNTHAIDIRNTKKGYIYTFMRSARMRIWQYRITQENRHAGRRCVSNFANIGTASSNSSSRNVEPCA